MTDFDHLAETYGPLAPGWGNTGSGLMFIGDAPGARELLTGEPFSGVSGRFFDDLLASINLPRDEIYLTNVVKFRPEKRDPNKQEIAAFRPLLMQELHGIRPKLVVTLGRISLNCFLPLMKISDIHGQDFKIEQNGMSFTLMPLYHPAAAMHNGQMRPMLKNDFLKLGEVWQRLQS
ncbi:MAG: uracil-DNA glycosylase [Neisseria sp.]|nr:uracil-DNA glycosylase [Neisseria sp.]